MKFFFDCQILQTHAYDRGMGKYCLRLLHSLLDNDSFTNEYEVILVFNKNLNVSSKRINHINTKSLTIIMADLPIEIANDTNSKYIKAKEILTDIVGKYISGNEIGWFFIPSPFFVQYAATYPDNPNILKACLIYDIIPYLIWHKQKIFPDELYLKHFEIFLESNRLFTISETVKKSLIDNIGIEGELIKVIDAGVPENGPISYSRITNEKYILLSSAPIIHKNTENAVRAFEEFNKTHNNLYKLLITSFFDKETEDSIKRICRNVIFTGNVSDSELVGLYKKCEALLFASLIEGLGLPILEAVNYQKPVACSNIDVFTEISKKSFYYFDPLDINDISRAINEAVSGIGWKERKANYPKILKRYNWSDAASIFHESIRDVKLYPAIDQKEALLLKGPNPNTLTPAGRFIEKYYATLASNFEVSCLFADYHGKKAPSYVANIFNKGYGNKKNTLVVTSRARDINDKSAIYVYCVKSSKSISSKIIDKIKYRYSIITLEYDKKYDKKTDSLTFIYKLEGRHLKPNNFFKIVSELATRQ